MRKQPNPKPAADKRHPGIDAEAADRYRERLQADIAQRDVETSAREASEALDDPEQGAELVDAELRGKPRATPGSRRRRD